jgi:YD repeat-containing protein
MDIQVRSQRWIGVSLLGLLAWCLFVPPRPAYAQLQTVVIIGQRDTGTATGGGGGIDILGAPGLNSGPELSRLVLELPPSKKNESLNSCQASPIGAHPVVYATGEKVLSQKDFVHSAVNSLSLSRTFRSASTQTNNLFGTKWQSSFDSPRLQVSQTCHNYSNYFWVGCAPDWLRFTTVEGDTIDYVVNPYAPMVYTPQSAPFTYLFSPGWVQYSGSNFAVNYRNRTYYMDRTTGKIAYLVENGHTLLTYSYYQGNYLTSVANDAGARVELTWDPQYRYVTSIKGPDLKVWAYQYDGVGNLTSVTPPAPQVGTFVYHYEDGSNPALLTGFTVDGVRQTRYAYDSLGRATQSGDANGSGWGESWESISYAGNSTVVTDSLGQITQYDFQQFGDSKLLVGQSRSQTSSCPAAAATNHYNANGFRDYSVDWNGVRTNYAYATDGRLLESTEAVWTATPRKQSQTWTTGGNLESVTDYDTAGTAFRKATYSYVASGGAAGWLASESIQDLATGATRVVSYSYSFYPNGNLASSSKSWAIPGGTATETTAYNSSGQVSTITNAAGHQTSYSNFDGLGNARAVVDPNGIVFQLAYDQRGQVPILLG